MKTMVPVGVPHVGCAVTLAVGVLGAVGTAFTVKLTAADTQLDVVFFTVMPNVPAFKPVN